MGETLTINPEDSEQLAREHIHKDPVEYWQSFKASDYYRIALDRRMKIIKENHLEGRNMPDADLREAAEVALSELPELAKEEFYDYYQSGQKLAYDSKQPTWSREFNILLEHYWSQIRATKAYLVAGGTDKDTTLNMDATRTIRHGRAMKQLYEDGLAPSNKIAEIMIQFMTASAGMEKLDPERERKRIEAIRGATMDVSLSR